MNFQQKRLLDLANKCINFGKYDYVKIILVRLLQNNTNNAEILSEISNLYIRMRRYDKAMAYAVNPLGFNLVLNREQLNKIIGLK